MNMRSAIQPVFEWTMARVTIQNSYAERHAYVDPIFSAEYQTVTSTKLFGGNNDALKDEMESIFTAVMYFTTLCALCVSMCCQGGGGFAA